MTGVTIERRIRWSGLLILAGLVVQMLSLPWTHPLAFLSFLLLGCPLVALGILLFLSSLVSQETP
jgi:hypothetical protein